MAKVSKFINTLYCLCAHSINTLPEGKRDASEKCLKFSIHLSKKILFTLVF